MCYVLCSLNIVQCAMCYVLFPIVLCSMCCVLCAVFIEHCSMCYVLCAISDSVMFYVLCAMCCVHWTLFNVLCAISDSVMFYVLCAVCSVLHRYMCAYAICIYHVVNVWPMLIICEQWCLHVGMWYILCVKYMSTYLLHRCKCYIGTCVAHCVHMLYVCIYYVVNIWAMLIEHISATQV